MLSAAIALLLQVGPNPSAGAMPGIPDELRDRKPRAQPVKQPSEVTDEPLDPRLAECLELIGATPNSALEGGQEWLAGARGLDRAHAANCVALAQIELGDTEGAAASFIEARDNVPQGGLHYRSALGTLAGSALLALGENEPALAAFGQAEKDAENLADGQMRSAIAVDKSRALVALSRTDEARIALENARTLDPNNAKAWLLSATLSRRMGELADAQSHIIRAAEADPRDPETGLEAGVIAVLSGSDDAARKSWQSVLEVAPESSYAEQARNYLAQLGQMENAPTSGR